MASTVQNSEPWPIHIVHWENLINFVSPYILHTHTQIYFCSVSFCAARSRVFFAFYLLVSVDVRFGRRRCLGRHLCRLDISFDLPNILLLFLWYLSRLLLLLTFGWVVFNRVLFRSGLMQKKSTFLRFSGHRFAIVYVCVCVCALVAGYLAHCFFCSPMVNDCIECIIFFPSLFLWMSRSDFLPCSAHLNHDDLIRLHDLGRCCCHLGRMHIFAPPSPDRTHTQPTIPYMHK